MIATSVTHFKAKLGQFMRAVRAGKAVTITDRDQPVARLVPFRTDTKEQAGIVVSRARDPVAPPLGMVEVQAISYSGPSTMRLLAEDRAR